MVVAQKNLIEASNETILKVRGENRILEDKLSKLRAEFDEMKEQRIKEKAKLECYIEMKKKSQPSQLDDDDRFSKRPMSIKPSPVFNIFETEETNNRYQIIFECLFLN